MDLISLHFPGHHGDILEEFRENWPRVFLYFSINTKMVNEKKLFFLTSQISRTAGLASRKIPAKFYKDLQN